MISENINDEKCNNNNKKCQQKEESLRLCVCVCVFDEAAIEEVQSREKKRGVYYF